MKHIAIAAILLLSYSAFGQYGLGNPSRTMQILGYQTSARGIVHYASGLPNTVIRWRATKDTSAYLWCDTLTSRIYNWNHTANKWETMGVMEAASAPAATQINGPATIDNRNAFWRSTSNNDFHYYDRDLTAWTAFGSGGGGADNWGTQVVETNVTLSGDGTAGTELGIAQQGATSGQVLKWNGTTWAPAADNTGGGGGTWGSITGTLSDQTDLQSALNAKANSSHTHAPGDITQSGATSGQVLKWNGSAWAPANDTDTDAQTLSFTEPNLSITGGNSVDLSGLTPTAEEHQDAAGAMVSGNTETLIAVTYDDPGGKLNFAVTPTLSSYTNDAGFLTGNQSISLSGDVTGSGTTAITTAIAAGAVGPTQLASTAVTPGSYTAANITVDADGRVTAASNGTGGATGHTIKDDGASMTQRSGLNFTSNSSINAALTDDAAGDETEVALNIITGAVGPTEIASTAVTPGSYTLSSVTVDADGRITAASNGGEVDGSVTNEGSLSVGAGTGSTSLIQSNTSGSATVTITGAGIASVSETGNTITITATEVDGSTTNEIQDLSLSSNTLSLTGDGTTVDLSGYLDNTDAQGMTITGVSAPFTLDISGGTDVNFNAGSGISISESPANTLVITNSAPDQTVSIANGGGVSVSGTYPAFTLTATDQGLTNEGSLTVNAGTGTTSVISSNTSGSTDVTLTASTGLSIGETGNVITLTNTGDTDASNDLTTASTAGGDLSGTFSALEIGTGVVGPTELASTAVTPGSYTAANITVDADGRITAASNGTGGATGHVIKDNGASETQRAGLNFISTSTITAAVADDAGGDESEVTMAIPTNGVTATEIAASAVGTSEVTDNTLAASDLAVDVVSSLDGVTNDGANIDLVSAGIVTITPDDATNTITISATEAQSLTITGAAAPFTLDISSGTDVDFNAGAGIGLSESPANTLVITNTGDTNAADDLTTATSFSGDVSGAYNNLQIGSATVGTAEIADGSVAYADIQNISATDKVLGRSTAGAGSVEEIAMTAAGRAIIDDASAADQRTTLGLGTIATQSAASVTITGGSITGITDLAIADGGTGAGDAATARTNLGAAASGANTDITSLELNNTGLTIDDTDGSHQLLLVPGSNLTADHTLTVTTGDADRTLTMTGDASIAGTHTGTSSGTNTGDQTITLTGDVTGSGTGSFSATIGTGVVGPTQLASTAVTPGSYTLSSITVDADGRITAASNGSGGGTNYQTLRDDGSGATQQPNANFVSNSDVTFTLNNDGGNSETEITADIPAAGVDYTEIQNVSATDRLLGRSTAGAGTIEEITCTAAGRAIIDDADASAQRTTLGLGTMATQSAASVSISGGSITGITDLAVADGGTGASTAAGARTNLGAAASGANTDITSVVLNNTGLVIKDSDASHNLTITTGSNITAARTLTINPGDVARTLTLGGDATLNGGTHSGTNTGDQTITLTGDVTGSGTGSFSASISANAVGNADFRQSAGLSVVGRSANTTGDVADIAGTDGQVLRVSGTTLGFGTVATAGLADGGVTMAKISQSSAATGQVIAWNGTAWAPQSISASLVALNAQTGTTYTLVLSDAGKTITMSNAAANTLTVPPNSSVAFPTGTVINIVSISTGQTTLSPGSGVTLSSADAKLKLRVQYSSCSLIKTGTDTWIVVGDLST